MAWSNHGDFIASGDESGIIKIMNSSIRAANLNSGAHSNAVQSIDFSHSDSKYVSCSDDTTIRFVFFLSFSSSEFPFLPFPCYSTNLSFFS